MIFYRNGVKSKKTSTKEFYFDAFQKFVNSDVGAFLGEIKSTQQTYNFNTFNGELLSSYGFKDLQMPTDSQNIQNEEKVEFDGDKISAIWSMKWHDGKKDKYYIIYFNNKNDIVVCNLFEEREIFMSYPTKFTHTPNACQTQYADNEAIIFTAEEGGLSLLTGAGLVSYPNAPRIISICTYHNKNFAISATNRKRLIYSDTQDVTKWTDENTSKIIFDDERGKLTKVLAIDDFVVAFRDFGISKISEFASKEDFDVTHQYQTDSYIYPGTISSSGDKVFFLDGAGLFAYNGSSVSKIDLGCDAFLQSLDLKHASAVCFEGKYFLACRYDYNDGQKLGCENEENYINNILIVIDIARKKLNVVRGVDINMLCVLNNPFLSKVTACFNGDSCGRVGELTQDGFIFEKECKKFWTSGFVDFGYPEKTKRTKYFTIKSNSECVVTIESEKMSKKFVVDGKEKLQRIKADVYGKELKFSISCEGQANVTNVKLGVALI